MKKFRETEELHVNIKHKFHIFDCCIGEAGASLSYSAENFDPLGYTNFVNSPGLKHR